MRFRHLWFGAAALLLLSHCATKHQPSEFVSYFPVQPDTNFDREQRLEEKALESLPSLDLLQNRRLLRLYSNEMNSLKQQSPRYVELKPKVERFKSELKELDDEVSLVRNELAGPLVEPAADTKPAFAFTTPGMKKVYNEALQLWNRQDAPGALKQIDDAFQGILKIATSDEIYKWEGLRFRILLEQADLKNAEKSYTQMRSAQSCHSDTAQAGFLLSLLQFSQGDSKAATTILQKQCDPKDADPLGIRRRYWLARFSEGNGTSSKDLYKQISDAPIPSYYSFLAQIRLGTKIALPETLISGRSFLRGPLSVSSDVDKMLSAAEERLRANLRKDAGIFLTKASRLLRQNDSLSNVAPLLYTAYLCQAAGNHLEAMRIYSKVSTNLLASRIDGDFPLVTRTLLGDMFPRPFQDRVEWLSRMWGVDPDFVYAIIRQESAFNPTAVSSTDARGLMQLMPWLGKLLAKQWGAKATYNEKTLFNAEENLKFGIYYVHQVQGLIPHLALSAASYNAGITRVMSWWKRYGALPLDVFVEMIPVNETRGYVKLVLRNFFYYKILRTNQPLDPSIIPFNLGLVRTSDVAGNTPDREVSEVPRKKRRSKSKPVPLFVTEAPTN